MEREVFLAVRENLFNRKKIRAEIENIKRMLWYIESFEAFCENNEVFDLGKRQVIKRSTKLLDVYEGETDRNACMFIIGKN